VLTDLAAYSKFVPACITEFTEFLQSVHSRCINQFASLRMKKLYQLLLKTVFQEAYIQFHKGSLRNYQIAYLLLLEQDAAFVVDEKLQNRVNNSFTTDFSVSLQKSYSQYFVYQFLKFSRSSAQLLLKFFQNEEITDVIIDQTKNQESFYVLHAIFENFFSENQQFCYSALQKLFTFSECTEQVFLDLVIKLSLRVFSEQEYKSALDCHQLVHNLVKSYFQLNG